jgi:hypothetical protein
VTPGHEQEAAAWVSTEIQRLRTLSYEDLAAQEGLREHRPMETAEQKALVMETMIFWDDGERQNLRVMVDVWDPSKHISCSIVIDDFIRAPDGSFIDD